MKIRYDKTTWVDNETPVNASNMNKIENALENLYNLALSPSDFATNSQIKPTLDGSGDIKLSFDGIVLKEINTKPQSYMSKGNPGEFYIEEGREDFNLYICLKNDLWMYFRGEKFNNN